MSEGAAQPRRRGRRARAFVAFLLLAIFAAAWTGLYGMFELGEDEVALISRAGRVVRQVEGPGRFVHRPFPLERRAILSRSPQAIPEVRVPLVTSDAQLLDGVVRGGYRVVKAASARYGVRDPAGIAAAALRQTLVSIAAREDHDRLRAADAAALERRIRREANARLASLGPGVELVSVELQLAMPEEIAALEEEIDTLASQRDERAAEARREGAARLTRARVDALEVTQQSQTDREIRVAKAEGEAERFRAVAGEYLKAPEVVKTRIYLETMEKILGSARVVIAAPGSPLPMPPQNASTGSSGADAEGASAEAISNLSESEEGP